MFQFVSSSLALFPFLLLLITSITLVSPRIVGKMVEDVVVIEGESLELECDFEADPIPEIFWFKDGTTVGERIQVRYT